MSTIEFQCKWQNASNSIHMPTTSTVNDLAEECKRVFQLATVKMVGLTKGKFPEPDTVLSTLHPAGAKVKLMLIGTTQQILTNQSEQESLYEAQRLEEEERQRVLAHERRLREEAAAAERRVWEAQEAERARVREEQRRVQQAEWEARRREEEKERLERELAAEQNVNNTISLELIAFHAPPLDATQKILLPPQSLQEIVNAKVQFPLTFQIMKPESADEVMVLSQAAASASASDTNAMDTSEQSFSLTSSSSTASSSTSAIPIVSPLVSYYAVADFTAPPGTVSVPLSLLQSLRVSDGTKLRLTTVNLKRATAITIQPLTSAWMKLPESERRALLEFQLRKKTFLVQDSLLRVVYHPHLPTLEFRVVETKPEPVVSITDSDIATEILPYEEAIAKTAEGSSSSSIAATPSSDAAGANVPKLVPDEVVSGKLSKAQPSCRFQYEVTDPNLVVTFDVKCVSGDVDIYVLNNNTSESEVDVANFTWAAQSKGTKQLVLSASDHQFQTGAWQVLLRSFNGDSEFQFVVRETHGVASSSGHQLSSSSSSSSSSISSSSVAGSSTASSPPPDTTLCSNCKNYISNKSMAMHSVQCARINYACPSCGVVVKTNEKEKHQLLVHSQYTCLCGVSLEQNAMVAHKKDSCSLRLVGCLYCPLKIVAHERGSHQQECGMLTSHCPSCAKAIQRKVMRRHLVREHGGINGKTDEREITFSDFWH